MTSLFLAPIKGQLIGIDKEWVSGVGACKVDPNQSAVINDQKYLRLPSGERALIFDFQGLFENTFNAKREPLKYYLILHYKDRYTAIPIHGRGQWVSVTEPTTATLPPAFTKRAKELIPRIILNGNDIILLPDMDALLRTAAAESSYDSQLSSAHQPTCKIEE
ncbi:MAG: hypothetical protein PHI97_05830 [Desulfobulbus sp.]|nr:hypothetical protein [Desulfobulbus sp.]